MLFNSYVFVAAFLPLTLGGFAVACRLGRTSAAVFLLVASLLFYGWWNPRFLSLLAVSIGANFAASALIMRYASRPAWQDAILIGAITGNLAALFWCKYLAAVLWFLRVARRGRIAPIRWLPLGISFFTFTQIGFLVDCRQGQAREPSLLNYALFVSFFPHLIAGPVLHHRDIMPQFADPATWRLSGGKPRRRQRHLSDRPTEEDAAG